MPRALSQRVLLLGATALVAPAVLFAGPFAPRPALAECTVTEGGGTAAAPGDGATVTCTAGEEPESDRVGDATTDAVVVLEADARINTTEPSTDAILLDDARVTLGDRAQIVAGSDGIDGRGDLTVTLGTGARVEAGSRGVFAYGGADVTLDEAARIEAGSDGVRAVNARATVTLDQAARINAAGDGVRSGDGEGGDGGNATVILGTGAAIIAGDDGVDARRNAVVDLGANARIDAGDDGVYTVGDSVVTLGEDARIVAGNDGVYTPDDTAVTLGADARIYAVDDGVIAYNGTATVTLGREAVIDAGSDGVRAGGGDGSGGGDAIVTMDTGARIVAGDEGVYADGDATVQLGENARIDAGGFGVSASIFDDSGGNATVSLDDHAVIVAGADGVNAPSSATLQLGEDAVLVAGDDGVDTRGNAVVDLGANARIDADDRGVFAFGNATVTLGPGARIDADRYGVDTLGDAVVDLGANAVIEADDIGVFVSTGTAAVTLGAGSLIDADATGVAARDAVVTLGADARIVARSDDGVYADSDATVTLGAEAAIEAEGIGVYVPGRRRFIPDVVVPLNGDGDGGSYIRDGGAATVTLGENARIEAGDRGVAANETAVVTLGAGASVIGGEKGVYGGNGPTGDVIDSAGTIEGGDYSLFLRGGDDRVTLRTGANLVGLVDGGAGTDSLTLRGSGSEDEDFVNFETLTMDGVDWTLSGSAAFAETHVVGGTLTVGGLFDGGDVAIDPGAGLVTEADATLDAFSFRSDGSVVNNGTITANTLVFGPESTLSGAGDVIGSVTLLGLVAPGNSVGTLTFTGDTTFGSSSVLEVDVSPVDGSDQIVVEDGSLTIEPGAQLSVNLLGGGFEEGTTFTFLQADDGISGSFVGFEAPLLSFTQQLELDASDPNTLSFRVATAPGDRLIAEAPYNPVNGGPASLLPTFAANDFGLGVPTAVSTEAADADGLNGIGFGYQRFDIDDTTVETWTVPLNRTFPLDAPGWAVVVNVPLVYAEVEGETAFSGSVGVGVNIPVTDDWTVTPTVRLGGTYSDDFSTMAGGYGGSLTSRFRFSLGDFAFDLGNLVGYYAAEDVGRLIDDQVAYDTENITFRNGLVMSTPVALFDRQFDTQLFAIDTRHTGEDLFVDSYTEFGASVRPRRSLFGLPPLRIGVTGTVGDDVSGIRLNAGYRF